MQPEYLCPACTWPLRQGLDPWHFVCLNCGYQSSTLEQGIRSTPSNVAIDENSRASGLKDLRERNFQILVRRLAECGLAPAASVLDVGCAHGWFMSVLAEHGYDAVGIEPDRGMVLVAKSLRQNVYEGFFPDDLPADKQYDAITFNDVFEHLPNVDDVARHCYSRLKDGGILLINVPNAEGVLFRIARAFRIVGVRTAWDRLWQKGLPSPHLSYFGTRSLRELARRSGFSEVTRFEISADQAKGSWQRIRYTGMSIFGASVIWLGLLAARPILKLFQSDAVVFIFRKQTPPLTPPVNAANV